MKDIIYLDDIGLSARVRNRLKLARIDTLEQLQQHSEEEILKIRGIGEGAMQELKEVVESSCGIRLF